MVINIESGGKFYLNFCDYLNQYDEIIPTSCTGCHINRFFFFNVSLLNFFIYFKSTYSTYLIKY